MTEHHDGDRLADLERRIGRLETERELLHLMARYSFTADLGLADEWVALWTVDGLYDLGEGNVGTYQGRFEGQDRLRQLISGPGMPPGDRSQHHTTGPLAFRIGEDEALAEGYSVTFVRRDAGVEVWNLGFNRWRFVPVDGRWRIAERVRREVGAPGAAEAIGATLA